MRPGIGVLDAVCSSQRLLLAVGFSSLCSCSTFVTYVGPELPDSEVATFHCFTREYLLYSTSCRATALDGRRPTLSQSSTNTSKVLPGRHWIEVAFDRYCCGGHGGEVCAFYLDWEAGHTYQLKAHSLETDRGFWASPRGFYGGSVEIEVKSPSAIDETKIVRVTCSYSGGSMCQTVSDCQPHPTMRCLPQNGFEFGKCS